MPDWPITRIGGRTIHQLNNGTASTNASANVKGNYTDVVTSTSEDCDGIFLALTQPASTVSCLCDLAIGGAGSETIIAANLLIAGPSRYVQWYYIPIPLAAGTRISVRAQCSTGASSITCRVVTISGGFLATPPAGIVTTIGANTADSGGTELDAGAVGSTYGSWVQLSASTSVDVHGVAVAIGSINNSAPHESALNNYVELGVGGAGSEQVILELPIGSTAVSGAYWGPPPALWWPVSIPAGQRLAARAKSNSTDATDRKFDVIAYTLTV